MRQLFVSLQFQHAIKLQTGSEKKENHKVVDNAQLI